MKRRLQEPRDYPDEIVVNGLFLAALAIAWGLYTYMRDFESWR